MAGGLSMQAFAGKISVTRVTIDAWKKKHPAFSEAFEIGMAKCLLFYETQGVEGLWSSKERGSLNTGVWLVNMRNRFGWKSANTPDAPQSDDNEHDISALWEKNKSEK